MQATRVNKHLRTTGMLVLMALAGCGDGDPAATRTRAISLETEVLASRNNCIACHDAGAAVNDRIGTMRGPVLIGTAGSRMHPDYLREFLLDPHGTKPDSLMPDTLAGLSQEQRESVVEGLVHFLAAQGAPFDTSSSAAIPGDEQVGRELFESIGCMACHDGGFDHARLARKTNLDELTKFLVDPVATRPCGRMPGMNLDQPEAQSIATWLLRDQAVTEGDSRYLREPGLKYEYFHKHFSGTGPSLMDTEPLEIGRTDIPSIEPRTRDDLVGFRFTGEILVPRTGDWTFHLGSDDGSALWIDGKQIINHGNDHGMTYKSGTIQLEQGWHAFMLSFYNAYGEFGLDLQWEGPGVSRQTIPGESFSSRNMRLEPPGLDSFIIDPELVRDGARSFKLHGCTACHVSPAPGMGPRMDQLDPESGCLSDQVDGQAPRFPLEPDQREQLRLLVDAISDGGLAEPLEPDMHVQMIMQKLDCMSCHSRDEFGGPGENHAIFVAADHAEMGDEGRIPPDLSGVGNKLRTEAIASMLMEGDLIRPYMKTRMPQFGDANVKMLPELFARADMLPADSREPRFDAEIATTGRDLVGVDGVNCIQCHELAGHPSLGIPAVDLATVHRRIRPGWFRKLLEDPMTVSPGTRMTRFWIDDERIFPEHMGGDPGRQMDAIWTYLSLGESMPLPKGLVVDRDTYTLTPVDEPMLCGVFMDGVSPRTLACGFPERVHVAFDMENARMAKAWKGEFLDARGTWHARAGQLENPAGTGVHDLPDGPAFALVGSTEEPWPEDGPGSRWNWNGSSRDEKQRPVFHYSMDDIQIQESAVPLLSSGGTRLVRDFTVRSSGSQPTLYMRAATGDSIEPNGEGHVIDGQVHIFVHGAQAIVRENLMGEELLVRIPMNFVGRDDTDYEAGFKVEMKW